MGMVGDSPWPLSGFLPPWFWPPQYKWHIPEYSVNKCNDQNNTSPVGHIFSERGESLATNEATAASTFLNINGMYDISWLSDGRFAPFCGELMSRWFFSRLLVYPVPRYTKILNKTFYSRGPPQIDTIIITVDFWPMLFSFQSLGHRRFATNGWFNNYLLK